MPNLEPDDVVGSRVREVRKSDGLSAEQLAKRCADAGQPQLSETAIYLIEGGGRGKAGTRPRRRVTVEELFVLAYALGVSPMSLLLPRENLPYQITPAVFELAVKVGRWLLGYRPLPAQTVDMEDPETVVHPGVTAAREARFRAEIPAYLLTNELDDGRLIERLPGNSARWRLSEVAAEQISQIVFEAVRSASKSEKESSEEADKDGKSDDQTG